MIAATTASTSRGCVYVRVISPPTGATCATREIGAGRSNSSQVGQCMFASRRGLGHRALSGSFEVVARVAAAKAAGKPDERSRASAPFIR